MTDQQPEKPDGTDSANDNSGAQATPPASATDKNDAGRRGGGTTSTMHVFDSDLRGAAVDAVVHELRTPLAVILGYTDLLQQGGLGALEPDQLNALRTIFTSSQELLDIVESFTALLTARDARRHDKDVVLPALLETLIDRCTPQAAADHILLSLEIEPGLPRLQGDSYLIEQAISALLDNAFKFTPQGGRVRVRLYRNRDRMACSVQDTGIGIDANELRHIFRPFYQVDRSSRRRYRGVGLGLAVALQVAQLHGGTVTVRSQPGAGSTFTLWLPVPTGSLPDPARALFH